MSNDGDSARVSLETAREVVRLSELYLSSSLQISLAADSRAMQLAGILTPTLIAVLVGGFAMLAAPPPSQDTRYTTLGVMLLTSAPFLAYSLFECLKATKPRPFHVPGNYLREWDNEQDLQGGDLSKSLVGQARVYQEQIDDNIAALSLNGKRVSTALGMLALAPVFTLISGIIHIVIYR